MHQNSLTHSKHSRWWDAISLTSILVFAGIVGLGVASRFWLIDWPNFKPVAALVLFAGFYFRRWSVALGALVAMMVISDALLGFYEPQLALAVYASLLISAGLGIWMRSQNSDGQVKRATFARATGCSLLMSLCFFILTNAAVWTAWYPATWQGLRDCYVAALPFFRATLVSDLLFCHTLMGVYALALSWQRVPRSDSRAVSNLNAGVGSSI